jgi:hypothetical protein
MAHEQLETILKVVGSGLSGAGSLILAWRVGSILKWVKNSLVAHETNLIQTRRLLENKPQTEAFIEGLPKHLLHFQNGVGFYLLIAGFACLGTGMVINMIYNILYNVV